MTQHYNYKRHNFEVSLEMNWKRTLIERASALLALGGVLIMVSILVMEIQSSPIVVGVLGVSAMLSVLLIYGVAFAKIRISRSEITIDFDE
jgi:hypothetical protein